MATLFNQTNISPGTSFATGGGGGSNFSNGIVLGPIAQERYIQNSQINNGLAYVTFWNATSQDWPTFINTGGMLCYNSVLQNQVSIYRDNGISYTSTTTAGTPSFTQLLVDVDFGQITNNFQTNNCFALQGISSVQSGTRVIDANKLLSTVQGYGWA